MKDALLAQLTSSCFKDMKLLFISSDQNFSRYSQLPLSFQQTLPSKGRRLMVVSQLCRSLVWRIVSSLKEFLRWFQERVEDRFVRQVLLRPPNVRNKHPPRAHSLTLALAGCFHRIIVPAVEIIHSTAGYLPPLLHFQSFT